MDLRNRRKQLLLQERLQQSSWCPTHFGISSSTVSGTRCFSKRSRTLFVVESMELLIIITVHPKLPKTTKHKTSEKWSECIWNFSLMTLTFINDENHLWNWKVRRWILVGVGTKGARGAQFPGRRITMGRRFTAVGVEKSQQCCKHFLQYRMYASERYQVRTWGRQTCFLPRATSNLVTPLKSAPILRSIFGNETFVLHAKRFVTHALCVVIVKRIKVQITALNFQRLPKRFPLLKQKQ